MDVLGRQPSFDPRLDPIVRVEAGRLRKKLEKYYENEGRAESIRILLELVVAARAKNTPGLRSAYDKMRIRRSIEYPVAGVAVALRREGTSLGDLRVAFTGTNPRPVLLDGTGELCGGPLDDRVFKGLDALVRDQIMAMKTTFTPGHYRRRVAGVLARRLVASLWGQA